MKYKEEIEELFHLLVTDRGDFYNRSFSCKILPYMFAGLLSKKLNKSYVIETNKHCVFYDGIDTYDLVVGCMFKDYKYPLTNIPNPVCLPFFERWFTESHYDLYYTEANLLQAKKHINIVEIKKTGQYNGTEKENN